MSDLIDVSFTIIPLVYNVDTNYALITNILLIFNEVQSYDTLVNSCNQTTLPIVYSIYSSKQELLEIVALCPNFKRLGFAFHDSMLAYNKLFLDNQPFFLNETDLLENAVYSPNLQFIIDLVKNNSLTNIDYLACNTLNFANWTKYYDIIYKATGVVVGASDDKTGNIKYGADWILESSNEDIKLIYFTDSIENYAYTFATSAIGVSTTITAADVAGGIVYTWPVSISGGTTVGNTVVISFGPGIIFTTASQYFICASNNYITFDGSTNGIVNDISINTTLYPGLIYNGSTSVNGISKNVTIQNMRIRPGSSTLNTFSAWITASYFGKAISGATYLVNNCSIIDGSVNVTSGGGVTGYQFGYNSTSSNITVSNCYNTGTTSGNDAGGIIGAQMGRGSVSLTLTITNCSNSGIISGQYAGGIFGSSLFYGASSSTCNISNCYNSGTIGSYCGGIGNSVGSNISASSINVTDCSNIGTFSATNAAGISTSIGYGMTTSTVVLTRCFNTANITGTSTGGLVQNIYASTSSTFNLTNCYNTGIISGAYSGGIIGGGGYANNSSTTVSYINISGCYNSALISGTDAGGIIGGSEGYGFGNGKYVNLTVSTCYNTGIISGTRAGGIVGSRFGYDISNCIYSLINCYNIGDVSGSKCGGIVGADIGYTDSGTPQTPGIPYLTMYFTNCYSNGSVATTCGGIIGGSQTAYYLNALPTGITLTNCYNSGTIVDLNSGLVAIGLTISGNIIQTNNYAANGSWLDASFSDPSGNYASTAANTPQLLTVFNSNIYSSYTTTDISRIYYSTTGLFTPSYSYYITPNTSNAAVSINSGTGILTITSAGITDANQYTPVTIKVIATKGTTPKYYDYNIANFIIQSFPCFKEGTKILTNRGYKLIENLRKGDLIKTELNGYIPINMIGYSYLINPDFDMKERIKERLYTCCNSEYPEVFEDLVMTGCHSILVDKFKDDEEEKTMKLYGELFITDNKYRLAAFLDKRTKLYEESGKITIYHLALDNENYYYNYGIYANGLLVESTSIHYLKELSNMILQ